MIIRINNYHTKHILLLVGLLMPVLLLVVLLVVV